MELAGGPEEQALVDAILSGNAEAIAAAEERIKATARGAANDQDKPAARAGLSRFATALQLGANSRHSWAPGHAHTGERNSDHARVKTLAAPTKADVDCAAIAEPATILFVRHAEALRPSERSPEQKKDPPLSDLGTQQAANLVNVLTPHIEATTGQIKVMSSPMLRCLHTISPTLSALQLPVLVHGEFFEFGCAGNAHVGSSPNQIAERLAESHQLHAIDFTHFTEGSNPHWLYTGTADKEQPDEFKARGGCLVEWIGSELVSQIGPGGLGIVVAHQTLNDLLLQLLVDGTDDNWSMAHRVFKLKNTAMVEVTVGAEAFSGGPVHYTASRPMDPPTLVSRSRTTM